MQLRYSLRTISGGTYLCRISKTYHRTSMYLKIMAGFQDFHIQIHFFANKYLLEGDLISKKLMKLITIFLVPKIV